MTFGTGLDESFDVAAIPLTPIGMAMNLLDSGFQRISPQNWPRVGFSCSESVAICLDTGRLRENETAVERPSSVGVWLMGRGNRGG